MFELDGALRAGDTLLTPSEAGLILGITSDGVRALNNKGKLPALKTLGGRRLFRLSQVERLAAERAEKAARNSRTGERTP